MAKKAPKGYGMIRPDKAMMRVAAERVGLRKAYTAGVFVATWAVCSKSLGRSPETIDEFSEWACQSRSQGFRQQQIFREAWPEFATPDDLIAHLRLTLDTDIQDVAIGEVLGAHFIGAPPPKTWAPIG